MKAKLAIRIHRAYLGRRKGSQECIFGRAVTGRFARVRGSQGAVAEELKRLIGGDEQFYRPGGVPVTVVTETLAGHIPLDRSEYLPLLADTLTDPYKVWASLERKDAYYELRVRAIKAYKLPGRSGSAVVIADGGHGFMQGWTLVPISQLNYLQIQRIGVLIYGQ